MGVLITFTDMGRATYTSVLVKSTWDTLVLDNSMVKALCTPNKGGNYLRGSGFEGCYFTNRGNPLNSNNPLYSEDMYGYALYGLC